MKRGRPKSDNPKDEVFRMRLTKQQSEKLKVLAEKAGCTPSEYLRMMISEEIFKRLDNIFLYGKS